MDIIPSKSCLYPFLMDIMNKFLAIATGLLTIVAAGLAFNLFMTHGELEEKNGKVSGLQNDVTDYSRQILNLNVELEEQAEKLNKLEEKLAAATEAPAASPTPEAAPETAPETQPEIPPVPEPGAEPGPEQVEPTAAEEPKPETPEKKPAEPETRKAQYRIDVDDILLIDVWENPDLRRNVTVRPDGHISFPLIDEVKAIGLTIPELDRVLTEKLKDYIRIPDVSVSLVRVGGKRIVVMGAVRRPGVFQVEGEKRVLEAMAMAGGGTPEADLTRILVMKGGSEGKSYRIDFEKALREDPDSAKLTLEAQDILYIPEKQIAEIMVLGMVNKPGVYPLKGRETALEAIVLAGGYNTNADLENLLIMRSGGDGIGDRVDIKRTLDFGTQDPRARLKAQDVLYVPPRDPDDKVLVMGEVRTPGVHDLIGGKRVLDAIAKAGGYSKDAVLNSIVVIKGLPDKPKAQRVDVRVALKKGDMRGNLELASKDIVFVPKSFIAKVDDFLEHILRPVSRATSIRTDIDSWEKDTTP